MRLAPLASDGLHWAISCADGTTCTSRRLYLKSDQRAADLGWATFFIDMRFVFVAEVFERADNRVWRALSKSAQAVS